MSVLLFESQLGNVERCAVLVRLIPLSKLRNFKPGALYKIADLYKLSWLLQIDGVDRVGISHPRRKQETEWFLLRGFEFQLRVILGMGICIRRIGFTGPFLQVGEAIVVGILLQHVSVGDRQSK